jgi:hypothetical protein
MVYPHEPSYINCASGILARDGTTPPLMGREGHYDCGCIHPKILNSNRYEKKSITFVPDRIEEERSKNNVAVIGSFEIEEEIIPNLVEKMIVEVTGLCKNCGYFSKKKKPEEQKASTLKFTDGSRDF